MRLLLFFAAVLLFAPGRTHAQTKQYLSPASICGGEAEVVALSDPSAFKRCSDSTMVRQGCVELTIFRYSVRCANGRVHSGPEVFFHAQGFPSTLRVEGDSLAFYLSDRQTLQGGMQPVWDRMPSGYAPLPKNSRLITKSVAPPPPPPVAVAPPPQPKPAPPPVARAESTPQSVPGKPNQGPLDKGALLAVGVVAILVLGGASLVLRGMRAPGAAASWLERVTQSSSVAIAVSVIAMLLGFSDEVKLASIGIGIFVITVAISLAT